MSKNLPQWFLDKIAEVTDLRPKRVLEHIRDHGSVTTKELTTIHGYDHAPRAARDVRERGFTLVTTMVKSEGKRMARYTFPDIPESESELTVTAGRKAFPAKFKQEMGNHYGIKCHNCLSPVPLNHLQVDHRVPYEIGGDSPDLKVAEHMLLCGSCNRTKSWTCEHCVNWTIKDVDTCKTCYWAYQESYSHVATRQERRIDIIWSGSEEVAAFDALLAAAKDSGKTVAEVLKARLT